MDSSWRAERIRRFDADREVAPIEDGLAAHDAAAVDAALSYLERDPRGFRTGYAKQRLLARLRSQELTREQRRRVNALLLRGVRNGFAGTRREYAILARRFADNDLRREVRYLLHSNDPEVAYRAIAMLLAVRRPALAPDDVAAVRKVVLAHSAQRPFFNVVDREVVRRFWTDQWEQELQALAREERNLGARRLLEQERQRRRVAQWRASRRRNSATPDAEARSEPDPNG